MLKKLTKTGLIWLVLSLFVIIADRLSKLWILHHLAPFESQAILPIFNLTLVFNKGAAFSFLHDASGWQHFFLGGLAGLISIFILYALSQLSVRDYTKNIALSLILGGAVSNAMDRLQYGHVIDFLDFHLGNWHFAIFNIADSVICLGAFLLLCCWMKRA